MSEQEFAASNFMSSDLWNGKLGEIKKDRVRGFPVLFIRYHARVGILLYATT